MIQVSQGETELGNTSEATSVLITRGKYTLEFKTEAVRLVNG